MDNNKLIGFYENLDKMESFTRIKTIYELTNNLDINLLRFFRKDFFKYHMLKVKNAMLTLEEEDIDNIELFFYDVLFLNDYKYQMADFCEYFDLTFSNPKYLDDFLHKSELLYPELYELERIAVSKIEKENKNNNIEPSELEEELIEEFNTPIVKRIIYLQKLGVIDFLRKKQPFNTSINSLANVFSGIIDAKASSIQPLLNIMLGNDIENPKNPLNSAKNVSAVENYLIKIGYPLK
jgi:hypothetical protein